MFKVLDQTKDNLVAIKVDKKIEGEDYNKLNQLVNGALSENRRANLYIEMGSIEGLSPMAIWEDLKFDFKNYDNLEKVAIVGEKDWEEYMTNMYDKFTNADVKFFEKSKKENALEWVGAKEHAQA